MKKLLIYSLLGIFSLMFSLYLGCKKYESPKNLGLNRSSKEGYRKPLQSKQETGIQGTYFQDKIEEPVRKKLVASAEACQKQFESCVKNCNNMDCEGSCLKFLSACEKHLPVEIQTLKEK